MYVSQECYNLIPRPIPSFSIFHAENLKTLVMGLGMYEAIGMGVQHYFPDVVLMKLKE